MLHRWGEQVILRGEQVILGRDCPVVEQLNLWASQLASFPGEAREVDVAFPACPR